MLAQKILTAIYTTIIILNSREVMPARLPLSAKELATIKASCTECLRNSVMVCGNDRIGPGSHFKNNFFQGSPPRGYLITPPQISSNFRNLLRTEKNLTKLKSIIHNDFIKMKLIAISQSFMEIYQISNPEVNIVIPEPLHRCLSNPRNRWGCGVSEKRELECCEKGLGSPMVKVTWRDNKHQEVIQLKYIPHLGATKLIRHLKNKKKIIYFCQTSEKNQLELAK